MNYCIVGVIAQFSIESTLQIDFMPADKYHSMKVDHITSLPKSAEGGKRIAVELIMEMNA